MFDCLLHRCGEDLKTTERYKIYFNQPDVKDEFGNWVKTYTVHTDNKKELFRTHGYAVWSGVLARTNQEGKMVEKTPSLVGNTNGFSDFNSFMEWCSVQEGYYQKSDGIYWNLDKDILFQGNKEYNEKTCAFVPQSLNKILILNLYRKGDCPLGVHIHRQTGKFRASLRSKDMKSKHLGVYYTKEEAHTAWQVAKVLNMKVIISDYLTLRGSRQDVADALLMRVSKIENDISLGLETKGWE